MGPCYLLLATVFLMGWPYRMIFLAKTGKADEFHVKKRIFKEPLPDQSRSLYTRETVLTMPSAPTLPTPYQGTTITTPSAPTLPTPYQGTTLPPQYDDLPPPPSYETSQAPDLLQSNQGVWREKDDIYNVNAM